MSDAYDKKARELVDKYDKGVDLNPGGRLAWLEKAIAQALREHETEREENEKLRDRLADLLTRTVNALRGQPPNDTLWSWHDLPELVATLHAQLAAAARELLRLEGLEAALACEGAKTVGRQLAAAKREVERLQASRMGWQNATKMLAESDDKRDVELADLCQRLTAAEELIHAVGKLALESGETWRLAHPELMDAYEAITKPQARKGEG